jgi:predicted dehydrogenase
VTSNSGRLGLGFIGAGFMAQLGHIENYSDIENCDLVALAEPRSKLRQLVADHYGFDRTYEDHTALLTDPSVDAVVVLVPRTETGPIVLECLNAGKHVFTEKPMAATAEQAERLAEAASANGVTFTVGFMKRHDPGVILAKSVIESVESTGELGKMIYARAHCFGGDGYGGAKPRFATDESLMSVADRWPMAPSWLAGDDQRDQYQKYTNAYCHDVNLIRYLTGQTPRVIHASLENVAGRIVTLKFAGFNGLLETGIMDHSGWDATVEIYFANGRIRVDIPVPLDHKSSARVTMIRPDGPEEELQPSPPVVWAFRQQARAFVDDVLNGTSPLASGADAVDDLRVIEEAWRVGTGLGTNQG